MIDLTTKDVFDFMNTGEQQRESYVNTMNVLIDRTIDEIEQYIGRKVQKTAVDIKIHNGRYCNIKGNKLYLDDIYYDIYEITTLTEDGTTLTENTDFVRTEPNVLERIDQVWYQGDQLSIEIVGFTGLTNPSDRNKMLPALKQIATEACAIKSGLWAKVLDDGEGNTFQVVRNNLPKRTVEQLDRFQLPVVF